jgi:hypothetical protein
LRVRLTERALSLKQRASATPYNLSHRASETGDECASGRASLRAATATVPSGKPDIVRGLKNQVYTKSILPSDLNVTVISK